MADKLSLVKQCLADVKQGKYTTEIQAHINMGGIVDAYVDPILARPV